MKRTKRPFSVLLVLAMLAGCLYLPARAEESGYEIAVLKIQKIADGKNYNADTDPVVSEVSPGDAIVLTVGARNKTSAAADVTSLTTRLGYDSTLVAPVEASVLAKPFASRAYNVNKELSASVEDDENPGKGWNVTPKVDTANSSVNIAGAGSNDAEHTYSLAAGGELWLYQAAFVVLDSAEGGSAAAFSFNQEECELAVKGQGVSTAFVDGSVTITGGGGGSSSGLTVTPEDTEIYVPGDGEDENTLAVSVQPAGTSVTWTLSPEINGVRMGANDNLLHVSNDAKTTATKDGYPVIITAKAGDLSGSATVLLKLAPSSYTLTLSPGRVKVGTETTVSASLKDQYGTDNDDFEVTVKTQGGGTANWASAYDRNKHAFAITVPAAAAEGTYTVTAQTGDGKSASEKLVVSENAATRPYLVTVDPAQAGVVVPDASGDDATVQFSALVKDDSGNPMDDVKVQWGFKGGTPRGFSVDNNGLVTVSKYAKDTVPANQTTELKVTATTIDPDLGTTTSSSVSGEALLTLTRAASVVKTLKLNPDKVTVQFGQETRVDPVVTDQYGDAVPGVTLSVSPLNQGVSVSNGIIMVSGNASPGEYSITAAYGEGADAVTVGPAVLTVTREASLPKTVEISPSRRDLTIPADAIEGLPPKEETASFTATVRDQFGAELKDQTVYWQIDRMEGVTIDAQTGLVTVTNAAKNAVTGTEGTKLTVTAVSSVNQGVYAAADLWIRRSAPVYSSIKILSGGNEIIKTDTVGIPSSKSYTTQILDQYGNPVSGLNASLELVEAPPSVRLNGTALEVPDDGTIRDGDYATLRASYNSVPRKDVTVVFRTVEVQWIDAEDITYGDPKSAAFYGVPGPATASQSDGTPINGAFSVVDPDVILTAGENRTVTLRFSAALNGTELNVEKTYTINVLRKPLSIPTQEPLEMEYSGQTSFQVEGVRPVGLAAGDEFTYTIVGTMEKRTGEQRAKITGLSLDDEAKTGLEANYQRPNSMGDIMVNVTKRPVDVYNVRPVSASIPYDQAGQVELTGGSLRNVVPGDDVRLNLGTGTVEGDVLGSNRPVTTHIRLIGADADCYELTQPTSVYVNVEKAEGVTIEVSDEPAVSTEDIPQDQTDLADLDYAQTGIQEFQNLGTGDASAEDDPTPYVYKDVYQQVSELHPDGEVTAEVIVRVQPQSFSTSEGMRLDVGLSFQVYKGGTKLGDETQLHSLIRPVTVAVNIPVSFNAQYAAHTLDDGTVEYMKVSHASGVATWKQKSFSPVTLLAVLPTLDTKQQWEATKPDGTTEDVTNPQSALNNGWIVRPVSSVDPDPGPTPVADTLTVTFMKSDGTTKDTFSGNNPRTFTASGAALPSGTETGFQGWLFPNGTTSKTLSAALWDQYKNQSVTVKASVQSETPTASITIRFMQRDGSTPDASLGSQTYTEAGAALPKPAAVEGSTFQHWTISGVTGGVTTVTQEVWARGLAVSGNTLNAVPVYTKNNTDADKGTITFLNTDGAVNTGLAGTENGVLEVSNGNVTLPAMANYSDSSYTYTFQGWLLGSSTTPVKTLTEAAWNTIKGSGTVATPSFGKTPISNSGGGGGSSGGGGGGGGSSRRSSSGSGRTTSAAAYSVSCTSDANGTVSAAPSSAAAGTKVTITVTPNSGWELDKLTVKNQNGNNIGTTAKDGQYTFTMPSGNVTVNGTFKQSANTASNTNNPINQPTPVDSGDSQTTPSGGSPFTDIAPGHPFYNAILWAAQNGVTTGTTPTTFSPDMSCTRAQAMTFFWRAAGQPEPVSVQNPFADIQPDAYYYKAVLWAVEQEITNGTTAATFSPNNTVTRGQIVTFLHRWSGTPLGARDNPFKDVWRAPDVYFYDAVLWAVEQGITNGTSPTTFEPTLKCTRGQIVTFLYRYMAQ